MSPTLERRLALLEQQQAPTVQDRVVWWDEGEPEPQAQPGERLTIIRWLRSDEDLPTGKTATARAEASP